MQIELIDFNGRFLREYLAWAREHPEVTADEDRADELYFEMLEAWMDAPKDWLGGRSPNGYFHEIHDPQMLVSTLIAYLRAELEPPGPLIHCLFHHADAVVPIFHGILMSDESPDMERGELLDLQAEIIRLLRELEAPPLPERYLGVMSTLSEDCAYLDEAAAALQDGGEAYKEILLAAYPEMRGAARACLLDLLSALPPDARIWALLEEAWQEGKMDDVFLAACMARCGDEAALPLLKAALNDPATDYYLFRELKHAVEAISGEEVPERDFSGDDLYDRLAMEDVDE